MLVLPIWATCLDHLAKQGWGEGALQKRKKTAFAETKQFGLG